MIRHKWDNDVCVKCGLLREMATKKLLMAITYHPPYDHYTYEGKYKYIRNGDETWVRPECWLTTYDD